ncbi:hypothetical protein Tco_1286927 [Tanacetum coccineum]
MKRIPPPPTSQPAPTESTTIPPTLVTEPTFEPSSPSTAPEHETMEHQQPSPKHQPSSPRQESDILQTHAPTHTHEAEIGHIESSFDLEAFSVSDYAGANLDRKSITDGCQFLRSRLISWQCKKQTIVATSTIEAEYVAAASCCGQVLWIQNQMLDYGFNFMDTKIHIDNESTICIVKNLVYDSKTKHIEIRHHFIRDSYEKKLIRVEKIHTDFNVVDLLTKAFDGPRFNFLVVNIG